MTDFDRFLPEPDVCELLDQGVRIGMVVRFQRVKSVRSVHPNPDVSVFFDLDENDVPVSITFLQPLGATAICDVIYTFVNGIDGKPYGVGRRVENRVIAHAVSAIKKAQQRLAGPEQLPLALQPGGALA
jgi:hypothetical protein